MKQIIINLLNFLDHIHHKLFNRCWWNVRMLAIKLSHSDCPCYKCKFLEGIYYDDYTLECEKFKTIDYSDWKYCKHFKKKNG